MTPKKRKVAVSKHLICCNCCSWVHFVSSGCFKTWAETRGESFVFTCKGCTEVKGLVKEVEGLKQMVEEIMEKVTGLRLEDKGEETESRVTKTGAIQESEEAAGNVRTEEMAVCKACNVHLYRLSSIRRYITTDAARSVVQALITSRLDYCNSLLANLTNTQMKRLKSIQHKGARLVTRTPLREHITPVLKLLHWLPVECRITYKLMVLVYKCVNGTAPAYLCRLIQPKCRDSRLRQPSDLELHRPVPKKAIGTAAFGFVGPDRWNKLPERTVNCF